MVAATLVLGLGLVACSEDQDATKRPPPESPSPTQTSGGTPPAGAPEDVEARCGVSVPNARTRFIGRPGNRLSSVTVGRGSPGVVLVHGSGSLGLCNWAADLRWMAEAGLRVLAYDQPCVGESDCDISDRAGLQRAVATLETAGASRIFVIAASAGGEAAITAAADPELDLASAVALSPVGAVQRVRFRTSLLIAGDPADSYLDLASLRAVATPSLVDLRLVRGGGHAQELLHSGDAAGGPSEFRRELLEFLRNA